MIYVRGQRTSSSRRNWRTQIFSSPIKQWMGPSKSPSRVSPSYVFFRVELKVDPHQFTLDEVKDVIRDRLMEQKIEDAFPELAGRSVARRQDRADEVVSSFKFQISNFKFEFETRSRR